MDRRTGDRLHRHEELGAGGHGVAVDADSGHIAIVADS